MIFRYVGSRLRDSYHRDPNLSTEEWSEKEVYFTGSDVSPIAGAFQLKYSPHFRLPFELIDKPSVKEMWHKWASQSGKSLFLLIPVAKRLDNEPANIIYAQPIKDDIPKIVDIKIDPVLKSIKKVWKKFEDFKVDEAIRGKREIKRIAGGSLIISGTSIKERKSLTSPMIVFDEAAEFEKGTVQEFRERQKSFEKFFPKTIGASTIVAPDDEICTYYDMADCKLQWQYECSNCEQFFYPEPDTLKWVSKKDFAGTKGIDVEDIKQYQYVKAASESGHVQCPNCDYKIYSDEKDMMVLNGGMDWVVIEGDIDTAKSFGTDFNSLGSYFVPIGLLVEMLVKANNNDVIMDKLYRGWFNRFWEGNNKKILTDDVLLLSNGLEEFVVPNDTVVIYMAVDTQKDHFWCEIIAIEYGLVVHTIYADRVEDFGSLIELFERKFFYANRQPYHQGIRRMCIDVQGYVKTETVWNEEDEKEEEIITVDRPAEVRAFVFEFSEYYGRDNEFERIYASRGIEFLPSEEPYAFGNTNLTANNYKDERKIKILKLGTVNLKLSVMASVYRTIDKVKAVEEEPAHEHSSRLKYINKTIIDKIKENGSTPTSYNKQIVSEIYTYPKDVKGKAKKRKTFVRIHRDNHFLDTSVMVQALAQMDNIASLKKPKVDPKRGKFSIARSLV